MTQGLGIDRAGLYAPDDTAREHDGDGRGKRLAPSLALAALFVYFSDGRVGIVATDEGGHCALVRSMANGHLDIDSYMDYTRLINYDSYSGHDFSYPRPDLWRDLQRNKAHTALNVITRSFLTSTERHGSRATSERRV